MRTKTFVRAVSFLVIAILFVVMGCGGDEDPINADGTQGDRKDPVGNEYPETYVSINVPPGELPDITTSRKQLNWWGEDPDGRVVSYQYRWGKVLFEMISPDSTVPDSVHVLDLADSIRIVLTDTTWEDSEWTEEVSESKEFTVPIRSAFDVFIFQVAAFDNDEALDPTPAEVAFPVINSPPEVDFRILSNPMAEPDTHFTFPIRTFVWDGQDPDGNETIEAFMYALNPSEGDTNWIEMDATVNSLTLDSTVLTPGEKVFWLKARDVAGFESNRIHFPDTTVSTDPEYWFVKAPKGRFLLVDDYYRDLSNAYLNSYRDAFTEAFGVENEAFSVWEIGQDLPFSTIDITETMMMFDRIFWYTYYGGLEHSSAFNSIHRFINDQETERRMIFSAVFLDSMLIEGVADIVGSIARFGPSAQDSVLFEPVDVPELPTMKLEVLLGRGAYLLEPVTGAHTLYRMDESTSPVPQYEGQPIVAVRRDDKAYSLFSVPLKDCQGYGNLSEVFDILFND